MAVVGTRADGGNSVVVTDPEAGNSLLLSLPVDSATEVATAPAFSADAAARTLTYRGAAGAYFVRQGQLLQVDLAQPGVPAAQRISALSSACQVLQVIPLQAHGRDAWIVASHAGADGNCATAGDNGQVLVRSGTAVDVPAIGLPAGVTLQSTYLLDDNGALLWMLAADATGPLPRLVALGPTLQPVEVAGGGGLGALASGRFGFNAAEGAYVTSGNDLRRVTATASSVAISGALHNLSGASGDAAYDIATLYFSDGAAVYALPASGGSRLVIPATPGYAAIQLLAQSAEVLIAQPFEGSARGPVLALNKRTGSVTTLLALPAPGEQQTVWALLGDTVFYAVAGSARASELRSVRADGTGDGRIYTGVQVVGGVSRALNIAAVTRLPREYTALLLCQPLQPQTTCRGSTLLQLDLTARSLTALGAFDGSSAAVWQLQGIAAVEGVRGAVAEVRSAAQSGGPLQRDFYTFTPGAAGSLKRVGQPTN